VVRCGMPRSLKVWATFKVWSERAEIRLAVGGRSEAQLTWHEWEHKEHYFVRGCEID
jgi:hypothetical protein